MNKFTAIIFDFDGVVADTENIFSWFDCELLNTCLKKAGHPATLTPEEVRNLAGTPAEEKPIVIGKNMGIDLSPYKNEYTTERNKRRKTLFAEHPAPLAKNIKILLEKLGKEHSALATNKDSEKLMNDIKLMGYDTLFETIIPCDPPLRRKPHPDIIIEAMKHINSSPEETAYIGDNINDMIAANAAGITPIGFIIEGLKNEPKRADALKDNGAKLIIDDFAELIPYI